MRRRLSNSRSFLTCRNYSRGSNIDFYGNLYAIDRIERSLLTFSGDIALRAVWSGRGGRRRSVWFRANNRKHRREMTKARVWKTEWKRERRIYLVVHLAIASSARAHTRALGLESCIASIDLLIDHSWFTRDWHLLHRYRCQIRPIRSQYDSILELWWRFRFAECHSTRVLPIYPAVIDVIVGTLLARMK